MIGMKAGTITEYDGQCWRQDEAADGFFDVMVLDRSDSSPWQEIPDIVQCYLCRELIAHSENLHEDVIIHHIQANELRDRVLNEIMAGIQKPEYSDNQVMALIYD